jgi:hypothetical protein
MLTFITSSLLQYLILLEHEVMAIPDLGSGELKMESYILDCINTWEIITFIRKHAGFFLIVLFVYVLLLEIQSSRPKEGWVWIPCHTKKNHVLVWHGLSCIQLVKMKFKGDQLLVLLALDLVELLTISLNFLFIILHKCTINYFWHTCSSLVYCRTDGSSG